MLLYKALAINILFSTVCLSSIGNDDKSMNAEHGFVPSHATNNNIVSDVNQGQSKHQKSITDSFALKKNSSLELYNLTEQAKKLNLTAERENLRLFVETSSVNNQKNGFNKAQAFPKESIDDKYRLTKSQQSWIALSYVLALCKYFGATPRSIISTLFSKLFGKPKLSPKYKISFTESADIPTIPSERTIVVQNDIACDEHVNTDQLSTNSSCDSRVESDDVTTDSSCDEHVNTDNEIIDLSCDSLVKADEEVAAINDISCVYDEHVNTDNEPSDLSCDSHMNNDDVTPDQTYNSHVDSDDDSTTTSVENLPAFIKIPPNKLELCETECGEIGLIVDPEYWDWLDLRNSSQESLTSDDGGTTSTGIESGQSYDVACDVDSGASSHSSCHSPVPKEVVSCLSCGSDEDLVTVNSDGGDLDSFHHTPCNGCSSSVNYGYESLNNSLDDCGVIREGYEELTSAFSVALSNFVNHLDECSEHGSTLQRSVSESDINFEVENNIQLDNQVDIADEVKLVQEDTMDMTLEQRVKNHGVATAIFAATFVLPCIIAAKLLK